MLTIFFETFLQLLQIWNQYQILRFFIPILNLLGIIFVWLYLHLLPNPKQSATKQFFINMNLNKLYFPFPEQDYQNGKIYEP